MRILHLRKGDKFARLLTFKVANVATDMTGWTVEASMRFSNHAEVPLTVTMTDAVGGVGKVTLDKEITAGLCEGEYELQIRATTPAGEGESCLPITVKVRA